MTDLTPEQLRERRLDDQLHADIQLKLTQAKWEPWKAVAALALGFSAMTGSTLALASWMTHQSPPAPQVVILRDAR